MAQIDALIGMMVRGHIERALLLGDKPMRLYALGQETLGQTVSNAQLQTAVAQVTPPDLRSRLAQDGSFHFSHHTAHGDYEIGIARQGVNLQVSITHSSAVVTVAADAPNLPPEVPEPIESGPSYAASNGVSPSNNGTISSGTAGPSPVAVAPELRGTKRIEHIDELFRLLDKLEASDLHLSSGETPMIRLQGIMRKLEEYEVNNAEYLKKLLWDIAPLRNREEWDDDKDTDFAYELSGVARFRCNLFADRHGIGGVFRLIPSQVLTVEQLKLPPVMTELCFLSKGLVVVTGPTGSGKSTTLAALIDHINKHREDHIITIEDPVEFVHNNINCLINQREVHVHTEGFKRALRAALREDPDIVLVGEMRDLETVAIAIETAETGHLVFGTLHTTTAPSTVDRIIDQFPADQQAQIRVMLSESLKGVIAQTLLRTKDGKRVAAYEILLVPTSVANIIREGKTFQLPSQMQIGKALGMRTMNDSILEHVRSGRVDPMEGFVKAVDKVSLISSYEANEIDFTPPGDNRAAA